MIVYDLGCRNQHRFEGWFSSSEDFEQQRDAKRLSCPLCGDDDISRLPHAPYVNSGAPAPQPTPRPGKPSQQYANLAPEALAKLIDHIVETTEDVGEAFPEEARRIHYGESPERRIRGSATAQDVSDLKEEGIEVVALPVPAHRTGKTH